MSLRLIVPPLSMKVPPLSGMYASVVRVGKMMSQATQALVTVGVTSTTTTAGSTTGGSISVESSNVSTEGSATSEDGIKPGLSKGGLQSSMSPFESSLRIRES